MRALLLITTAALFLSACSSAQTLQARDAAFASKQAYEECLKQNPDSLPKCDYLKRIYEADLQYYLKITNKPRLVFHN